MRYFYSLTLVQNDIHRVIPNEVRDPVNLSEKPHQSSASFGQLPLRKP